MWRSQPGFSIYKGLSSPLNETNRQLHVWCLIFTSCYKIASNRTICISLDERHSVYRGPITDRGLWLCLACFNAITVIYTARMFHVAFLSLLLHHSHYSFMIAWLDYNSWYKPFDCHDIFIVLYAFDRNSSADILGFTVWHNLLYGGSAQRLFLYLSMATHVCFRSHIGKLCRIFGLSVRRTDFSVPGKILCT